MGIKVTAVLLCLTIVFCLFSPVRSYYERNPAPFNVIVDYFTENTLERPVSVYRNVLMYGWSDVRGNEMLPQEIKVAMESILRWSSCTEIHIEMWDGELDYCSFSHFGKKVEAGIAFLPTSEKENELFSMRMRRQCTPIADNWVYYEVYTPLGEKDFPY